MRHLAPWSLVLGLSAAVAFAVPTVLLSQAAFAKGGGGGTGKGGSSGGGGSAGGGGKGGKSGGTGGSKGAGGPSSGAGAKGAKSNTANSKGRGDYLEQMQHEEADDARAAFIDDATADVVRTTRIVERGE